MGSTQELQHWGIKGQHWGIRRYQNPDGSLTEAGKKRYYYQNPDGSLTEAGKKDYMKAARKGKLDASKLSDNDLNMINARFAREKTFNQNVSDYEKSTLKYRLKEAAIARIKGSGGKKKGGGVVAKLLAEPVKKAFEEAFKSDNGGKGNNNKRDDSDSREDKETKPNNAPKNASNSNSSLSRLAGWSMSKSLDTLEREGYVSTGKKAAPKLFSRMDEIEKEGYSGVHKTWSNMSSSRLDDIEREGWTRHSGIYVVTRSDDYLAHHGIKGQKWGVRRFQNEDMTWTEAGKIRYGSGSDSDKHKFRKQFYMTSDEKAKEADRLVNLNKSGKAASSVVSREDTRKGDTREAKAQAVQAAVSSLLTLNPIPMAQLAVGGIKAANAQHKVNSYMKHREKNGQIDKKTGLYLKQSDTSYSDKQDLEAVNPGFENFNSNTKNNCMLCTTTYDLRKRGYDVTAQTDSAGFNFGDLKRWYPKAKFEKSTRINPDGSVMDKKTYVNNTISKLTKQGEGARGNIMVVFSKNFGGHSMVYEVKGGKLTIKDGQTGKIYSNPSKILNRTEGCSYARLDNVEPDIGLIKKECVR